MSEPKRYYFTSPKIKGVNVGVLVHEDDNAPFVKYSDYAALQAENERLRKAGDEMAADLIGEFGSYNSVNDWNAAKGVQS